MAREIKTTPVIRGKNALDFYSKLEANRNKKVEKSVLSRIRQSVDSFKYSENV
jgi:hypothetical protein